MKIKKRLSDIAFDWFNITCLTLLGFVCLYPFLYVTFASFSEPTQLMRHEGFLFKPLGFTLQGYILVFKNPNILVGYKNTVIYVICGTSLSVVLTIVTAYVLSRKKALYTKYLMFIVIFTMFFNGGLIPFYILIQNIGIFDTRWAILLPQAILTWNVIIMRTSFAQLPDSLEESAKIDGANDFIILAKIIVPISKPVIAVITLFYAVFRWNEYFMPMILLQDTSKFPLQLFLREILILNDKNFMVAGASIGADGEDMYRQLLQYSTTMVATVPILCVYPFIQKYFVKGIMIGAIKG